MSYLIESYNPRYRSEIRRILTKIGWAEQYIVVSEQNADVFSQDPNTLGAYVATLDNSMLGFLVVQFYKWNQLAQIRVLAIDPQYHRQGVASALVVRAEEFAREKHARGIYVDTPTKNMRGRKFYEAVGYIEAYIMPRYYEDELDGMTYQKFFD